MKKLMLILIIFLSFNIVKAEKIVFINLDGEKYISHNDGITFKKKIETNILTFISLEGVKYISKDKGLTWEQVKTIIKKNYICKQETLNTLLKQLNLDFSDIKKVLIKEGELTYQYSISKDSEIHCGIIKVI